MLGRQRTEKFEHIAAIPLFSKLSDRQLRQVAKLADEVTVEAGRVLHREDAPGGKELLIIVDGEVTVERQGELLARLGPGEFLGEMSILDNKPHSATVTAATDTVLLTLTSQAFKGILDDLPGLKDRIIQGLVERLRDADDRIIA